jgi:uncharacterized protein YndB with AHSA1/START domain
MTATKTKSAYGVLTEPTTLKIQRRLPGPIERVWAYLTDGKLRRKWLASGDMELKVGAPFEFVWRNAELTNPPGKRPEGFGEEHRMKARILALDPPHSLTISWGEQSEVQFELSHDGDEVMLSVIHRRLPDRNTMLMVGAGWHMHLDVLVASLSGTQTEPYWDGWVRLKSEYDQLLPR